MAQQLQKQGHEIALLAVLDTAAPGFSTEISDPKLDDAKLLIMIARVIEQIHGKSLEIRYDVLQSLEANEQLNYIQQKLQLIKVLPSLAGTDFIRATLQTVKANYQLHYVPPNIYPTRVKLFRAASEVVLDDIHNNTIGIRVSSDIQQEPTCGWSQFIGKPVETYWVPGNHITMMVKPHVQELAKYLKICLDRAQETFE